MLFDEETLAAVIQERQREVERLSRQREARQYRKAAARSARSWVWRIEPGMEEAFRSLRAWLLSSADEGNV